jgi:predicted kinase
LVVLVTGLQATGKSTIADAVGRHIGAPVIAHDWAMSGLRPFPEVQDALDAMDPPGHRPVGWSILVALARAQLRRDGSVVLDGVARAPEIQLCRSLTEQEDGLLVVIVTECDDEDAHRSRVEGRRRAIPDWYELDWNDVQRARNAWEPIVDADLVLSASEPLNANVQRLHVFLDHLVPAPQGHRERLPQEPLG